MLDKMTVQVRDGKEGYIDEARKLADSVQAFRTVRTFGTVQRGNNEDVGRYGLYWLLDQTEAEYGFVDGVASEIRSKQTAIIRALQIVVSYEENHSDEFMKLLESM
ncbi:Protein CBG25562 [Caenorhabditis briggsae]|uniref:Protein CBG25562 n=1 Tax=Caenorhabditis briggsae TaxID=6238 RepID=B6IF49_CAEBR|nr:Protein CBG25562 [Caenorhabditis briggsae]CAR98529.1 Protein CBG25562 [Caenorhabditis briggsae]